MKIKIGLSSDFQEGKGKGVLIEQRTYAVFRVNGELGCIGNDCVHADAPLCEGFIKNGKVVCPHHKWEFDHKSGKGFGKESQGSLHIFEENGEVFVETSEGTPRVEYGDF